jgi:ribosomal subunit interface protein
MKEQKMAFSWNIVAKNVELHEPLQKKFRQKIAKLELHLQHFPQEAVYLQVVLHRHPKKEIYTAALNLRLPSNILRSEKSAPDAVPAFDQAVKVLLRELETLKSELRHEHDWKDKRSGMREAELAQFAPEPMPPGEGPQALADMVRKMIDEHHGRLLYHVRRLIWRGEMAGDIPKGAVDPLAIVDEVARQACLRPEDKPDELSYRLWFYSLARHEFERRRREFVDQAKLTLPLSAATDSGDGQQDDGDDVQQQFASAAEGLMTQGRELGDVIPDLHTLPPDLAASEHDLIDHLHHVTKRWSPRESTIFELHFVEGFEPDEVAMIMGASLSEVKEWIPQVQERLRSALVEELDSKVRVRRTHVH